MIVEGNDFVGLYNFVSDYVGQLYCVVDELYVMFQVDGDEMCRANYQDLSSWVERVWNTARSEGNKWDIEKIDFNFLYGIGLASFNKKYELEELDEIVLQKEHSKEYKEQKRWLERIEKKYSLDEKLYKMMEQCEI